MQNFERIFDMHQPPFKADSLDAMEYSILGFFKAEDSSRPQLERISDHEIKVSIDERKAQKAQKQFDKAVEHSNAHKFNSAKFALREAIGLIPPPTRAGNDGRRRPGKGAGQLSRRAAA